MTDRIIYFKRYPLEPGQKIHIVDGPRKGDWQVVAMGERKMTLRCPVSGREVEWDRFCYFAESRDAKWPASE